MLEMERVFHPLHQHLSTFQIQLFVFNWGGDKYVVKEPLSQELKGKKSKTFLEKLIVGEHIFIFPNILQLTEGIYLIF